ncbi:Tetratricopeptide repeat protein [Posidoniimonas corsicana]|uniref:Tetratricopeptide repeat protein n=1 Tax=Posidoniimonas corsicana TaxID=1938618 RepID=A0A5C5V7C8_9BACT|nr:hypothetical protein [Posidoniimonas corsicana]TWT33873.1 Tetratricopeptide repeat protein [Posidoniimonas corsicana]
MSGNWFKELFTVRKRGVLAFRRGMVLANVRQYAKAIDAYTTVLATPDIEAGLQAMALYNRALALSASGDKPAAAVDLEQLLLLSGVSATIKTEARRKLVRMKRNPTLTDRPGGNR